MSTEIDLATELAAVKAQLKEQTQQMASMMSLAMPLLEEQTRKLRKEKEAEAARKKAVEELERKSKIMAEQLVQERAARQAERAKKAESERTAKVEADNPVTIQKVDLLSEDDEQEDAEDIHTNILRILGSSRWRANIPTPPSGPSYPNGFPGGPVPPPIFVPVNCPPGAYPIPCPRVRGGRY